MTSQHRYTVCLFCVRVGVYACVSVMCYRADEKEISVSSQHHIVLPEGFYTLLQQSPCATDKCACACTNSVKSVSVSLTVGVSVVTLGRGVSCVTNSNPDHSLWISYLLQSYKRDKKAARQTKTETYLGDAPDFGLLSGRTPKFILPPFKPQNKLKACGLIHFLIH